MKLRSMEEKISYRLFLMGFLGLVFTAALCILCSIKPLRRRHGRGWSARPTLCAPGTSRPETPRS